MGKNSVVSSVGIVILSVVMIIFSFLFNERGEDNVSLILLFAGIGLAFILVVAALLPKTNENK
ncbi:hypothetical protein MUO66_03685 [Candidatus Bathyarchaeota archaeon]|nr:hypothetical protein [Candidatus Bathyarchaeota archaeon]